MVCVQANCYVSNESLHPKSKTEGTSIPKMVHSGTAISMRLQREEKLFDDEVKIAKSGSRKIAHMFTSIYIGYIRKGQSIWDQIMLPIILISHPLQPFCIHWQPPGNFDCSDLDISEQDVFKVLASLDPTKSMGLDGIWPRLLKFCADAVCQPLQHLFITSSYSETRYSGRMEST